MANTGTGKATEFLQNPQEFIKKVPFPVKETSLVGAFTSPAPPASFNLKTASAADLVKNGLLWRRPDASASPGVKAAWDKIASRQWLAKDRIVPQFAVQKGKTHLLKNLKKTSDANYLNSAWAGSVITGKWTTAIGIWKIPSVSKPTEPQGTEGGWNSSSWVGIDGFGSNDVLQAGIQQHVSSGGQASYVAWYEWYAPPQANSPGYVWQTNITNFPVSPGQEIYVSCQYQSGLGYLYMANDTTGQHFSITLAPPPGANFNGDSIEWIMEAPDGGEPTSSLPKFSPVVFTSAFGCTATNVVGNPQTGDTVNVQNTSNKVLTKVILGNDTVTIDFIG